MSSLKERPGPGRGSSLKPTERWQAGKEPMNNQSFRNVLARFLPLAILLAHTLSPAIFMNQYLKFCRTLIDKTVWYLVRSRPAVAPVTVTGSLPVTTTDVIMPPKKIPSTFSGLGAGTSGVQHSGKKPPGKVATARGYKRPESLEEGFLLDDKINKRTWRIGELVGQGGFADVYTVSDHISKPVSVATAKHVLKLEPKDNAPLFQETKFFKAAAKKDTIATFLAQHKMKSLGVMEYIASGTFEHNDKELRWLVIPRLGQCVQKILEEQGGRFSRQCVIMLARQLIDILEYIHHQGYAHGDIKAGNMMTGFAKTDASQIYLIDFGLVKRFMEDDGKTHIKYREEPKAAHDGTLEFTSVDAHKGTAPARRGDLQILGFNLIKWTVGALPWSDSTDANFVKSQKVAYLQNITEFFRVAFPAGETAPKELVEYFKAIKSLEYDAKPDYAKLRAIFETAFKETKCRKSDLFQAVSGEDTAVSPKKRVVKPAAAAAKTAKPRPTAPTVADVYESNVQGSPKKPRLATKPPKKSVEEAPKTNGSSHGPTAADLAKLPPGKRREAVAAASEASTSRPTRAASSPDKAHASELADTVAGLPPGQRRKVRAALEKSDDVVTDEVLAYLPPGQRRKLKAAVAGDDRDEHAPSSSWTTTSDGSLDAGGELSHRPARAVKGVRSYAEDDAGDAAAGKAKGKRAKKSEP